MLALPSLHSRVRDDSFPILHTWMNSMTDDSMKAASELFISLKSESLDPCLTETVVAVLSAAQLSIYIYTVYRTEKFNYN